MTVIDEHEWKSVLQVAADGSFSAAARHLFVSQPSLSQCIKKIEAELGTKLFDRSQTPLKLTAAGEIYLKNAKIIQHLKCEMVKQTTDLQHLKAGVLTIGSSRTRSSCFLKRPLVEFHRKYPGKAPSVREVYSLQNCLHLPNFCRKYSASGRMSSFLTARGGTSRWSTFSL